MQLCHEQKSGRDPTIQFAVEHVDGDGDRAVVRWRVTGALNYRGVNLMRARERCARAADSRAARTHAVEIRRRFRSDRVAKSVLFATDGEVLVAWSSDPDDDLAGGAVALGRECLAGVRQGVDGTNVRLE